jgi:short-subunit dehydrogenase
MNQKTILITGCRRGIGRDAATALSLRGHHVIATVHREESVEDLKSYAKEKGVQFDVFKLDITDPQDQKKVLDFDIDILINNAGIGETGSLSEVPLERIRKNFETNVFGTLDLTQLALKKMMKKDSGSIIFVSSIAGRIPMAFFGPYAMTKYSLSAAADILRKELKMVTQNVHISVIEPGTYHTGFNQDMMATKYTWMDEKSYFYKMLSAIKKQEETTFGLLERKTTKSIVNKIVSAVESNNPRLHYSAPWWQALFVRMVRMFGV